MAIEGKVHVVLRDGRFGRDPAKVDDQGGEVLDRYDVAEGQTPPQEDDVIELPSGERVRIAKIAETFSAAGWTVNAEIGDIFDES